ncbi:MAG: Tim44 domain-containing protein [Alphaproteobacteria bacterium]|nr:Tim44 domain-containing protein [Alphaproteobacteria bacterium]MBQ8677921.1 Tim44 domain-containing protein [Alphaproteobacteria bacterium]
MIHFVDIIILLITVILIYSKLKNVLGTRPEETTKATPLSEESAAKIFDIIMKENERLANQTVTDITPESDLPPLEKELNKIPQFNKETFLIGAKRAFEIIITAFAKADSETLHSLVTTKLVKKLDEIIDQRKADGITAETDLIGFSSVEITDVKVNKSDLAKITVKFVSEQVNLLKDKFDKVIEGDENFVQNITDIWTFERHLNSNNPNWLLSSTKK